MPLCTAPTLVRGICRDSSLHRHSRPASIPPQHPAGPWGHQQLTLTPPQPAAQHFHIEARHSRSCPPSRKLQKSTLGDLHLLQAEGKEDPRRWHDAMAGVDSSRALQKKSAATVSWRQSPRLVTAFPLSPTPVCPILPQSMQDLTNPFEGQTDGSWQNGSQITCYILACMLKQSLTGETQFESQNIIANI